MSIARNMSKVAVDANGYVLPASLSSVDGAVFSGRIPGTSAAPGSSIQLVSSLYQWYNSLSLSTSWANVPNMSLSITPKFANSIVKVEMRWFGETQVAWDAVFGITRNGTLINMPVGYESRDYAIGVPVQTYIADDNNSTPELCYITTVDTPATTSPVTYQLVCMCNTTGRTLVTGKVFDTSNGGTNYEQGSCEIILTEYAP